MNNLVPKVKLMISLILLTISFFLCGRLIYLSVQNQQYRIELSEINSIRYGLLNADEWKVQLSEILTKKIEEFELTPENQEAFRLQIENLLYKLLDEVNTILKNDMGKVKRLLVNAFVDIDKLRESVPELAESLLVEMSEPENKESMKEYVLSKLDSFVDQTFNKDEQSKLEALLEKYQLDDKQTASARLNVLTNKYGNDIMVNTLLIFIFLGLVFILNSVGIKNLSKMNSTILLVVISVLLVCGISMPMIDIEAKISLLNFKLMGEDIVFRDQVLFFQTKSILDVVWILIENGKIEMIFVGILIFSFSVLFPFIKIVSTYLTILSPQLAEKSKFIYFFAYKSGKWSMADVFVVAMFMAFIGFNGIISDQLSHMSKVNESVEILTTNGTNLQAGFYLFLMFCLSGLFLSDSLQKKSR